MILRWVQRGLFACGAVLLAWCGGRLLESRYAAGLPIPPADVAAAILFVHELWLIRRREPKACFRAFNNNHYVGMVVFIGLALDYLYRGT